jgi:hypothetical protein
MDKSSKESKDIFGVSKKILRDVLMRLKNLPPNIINQLQNFSKIT